MSLSPRAGLLGGVALLSAAAMLLQIVLTRLFSALYGHHLAFLSVSLSLFGMGVGGALLYAIPHLARPPSLLARLGVHAALVSIASIATVLYLTNQKPISALSVADLGRLAMLYGVCAAPFVITGIAIAGAVRHAAREMSKLYLVDLVAAGAGGVSAMLALRLGAPRAVLVVAILSAIASLWFVLPMSRRGARDRSPISVRSKTITPFYGLTATVLLGSIVLFAGDFGSPWLKLGAVRSVKMDRLEFQEWSLFSFITVERPASGMAWMRMDGGASSAILDKKTQPPLHPDQMGYVLHKDEGPALIIGAGGGRDIRAALKAGQSHIDVVEIDPIVVNDVMRSKYKEYSDGLYDKPEVFVSITDGRSFLRSSKTQYRAIVISLVDTWAASPVGAFALTENNLYTVEAFRDYISHLLPEGTLTVNRWDSEAPRLIALAAAGLNSFGVKDPREHIFSCSHDHTTAVLVKRTPFEKSEIYRLRRHCNQHRFREVVAPDSARDETLVSLIESRGGYIDPESGKDLRAPTDDRPFFFHDVPARKVVDLLGTPEKLMLHQGVAILVGLFVVSSALSVLLLFFPLAIGFLRDALGSSKSKTREPLARPLLFFLSIGAGLVLIEMGAMQQLTLFLGHPTYSVTIALVSLLLAAGAGSLSTSRVALAVAPEMAARRAHILVGLLALYAVALGPVLSRALVLPFWARVAFTVALLFPPGALMGALAPLGVKLLAPRSARILPWCWGLSGLASVMGTALGTFVAMSFGFSATLLLGGASYLLASVTVPRYRGESIEALQI